MEQNISFDNLSPLKVKNFFKKACIASRKFSGDYSYANEVLSEPKEDLSKYNPQERVLRKKIQDLEQELKKTKQEKEQAENENRKKIDELNVALSSIKNEIKELIHYKKERNKKLRNLEKKIIRTVK